MGSGSDLRRIDDIIRLEALRLLQNAAAEEENPANHESINAGVRFDVSHIWFQFGTDPGHQPRFPELMRFIEASPYGRGRSLRRAMDVTLPEYQ